MPSVEDDVWQRDMITPAESDRLSVVLWFQTIQCHPDTKKVTQLVTFGIVESRVHSYRSTPNNGTNTTCNNHTYGMAIRLSCSNHVLHKSVSVTLSCQRTNTGITNVIEM